jgi:hypothetical protein
LIAALLSQNTGLQQENAVLQRQVREHQGISENRENHLTTESSQQNPVHNARQALAAAMRQTRGTLPNPRETDMQPQPQQDFVTTGLQTEDIDYSGQWSDEIPNIDGSLFVDDYGFQSMQ